MKQLDLVATNVDVVIEIDKFYTAFAYLYSPTFDYPGETHNTWEIVLLNNGEITAEVDGQQFILKKNQVIIHAPNEIHKIRANNVSCTVGILTFNVNRGQDLIKSISNQVIDINELDKNYLLNTLNEGILLMSGKNDMDVADSAQLENRPFAMSQYMKNAIELLLISLIRKQTQSHTNPIEKLTFNKNNIVYAVVDYINRNLDERITLESISKYMGYSVTYISMLFRKHLKTSLIAYVLNARINRAQELIAENKLSFKQISEAVGFESVQYFSTQFKKLTNQTPSQYQAICKHTDNKFKHADITRYI